jgi:type IV pilus assembly protein PilF
MKTGLPRIGAYLGAALLVLAMLGGCKTTTTINGVQIDPNAPVPGATEADPKRRAQIHLQLATSYYLKGQLEIAIDTAQKAVELDPTLAQGFGLLGLIYMDAGQVAKAEASFQHALSLDRDSPDLNNNYGWFLCQTGHERDSIAYFEKALSNRLYESPARALQNAGICQMRMHDDVAAESYLLRAFKADATSPVAKFQLAQLYLRQRRFDRADFYFDLLVHSMDPDADALWLGTRLAHAKGDSVGEREYAEQLQLRFPGSPQADAMHHGRYDE